MERLLKPFRRTLVVKLMGRQLSYGFMVKKLRQLWERKGNIEVFDLENEFFLVNFQHSEDYMEALVGGPWVIADAHLSVARWRPEFNPKNERIDSVVAWVRLLDLPAPLFDKKFLLNLGNSIGKAICLDVHIVQRARGKFARMCVELDLTKPLVPEFMVDGQVLKVEYESMGLLCRKCGRFGHLMGGCDAFHKKVEVSGMDVEVPGEDKAELETKDGEGSLWRTVQRVRKQRTIARPVQDYHGGSRFAVLNEEKVEEFESRRTEKMQGEGRSDDAVVKANKEGSVRHLKRVERVGNKNAKSSDSHGDQGVSRDVLEDGSNRGARTSKVLGLSKQGNNYQSGPNKDPALNRQGSVAVDKSGDQAWVGIQARGKENLHPGGSVVGKQETVDLVRDGTKALEVDVSMVNAEMGIREESCAPSPLV
ncbi:hypothetical protein K1719_040928 [Acacia pycnantha]|nr:hypothetical protein K1719_040928 [Acacia pycnantha]